MAAGVITAQSHTMEEAVAIMTGRGWHASS